MSSATVTSKGQVTIPLDVRRHLGLQPLTSYMAEVYSSCDYFRDYAKKVRK